VQVIAVMDLMRGCVVHARRGERAAYQPLRSRLCLSPAPVEVAAALLRFYPFDALYIADLDSILGRGGNQDAIRKVTEIGECPPLWIDAGISDAADLQRFKDACLGVPVVGSESLRDSRFLATLERSRDELILSLDFKGRIFLGPPEIARRPELWSTRVLALNLERVGSRRPPDTELLRDLRGRAPASEIYLAGGVRNLADALSASRAGAAGILVASALHEGSLTSSDLAALRADP
jgi:phosphoribosylformimino-5-aminoimidazole carboxamide ribotide isomerase